MHYINKETGDRSDYPWSEDNAIKVGTSRYQTLETCKDCGQEKMYRYVDSGECTQCAKKAFDYTWELWKMGSPDRPEIFPTTADEAFDMNVDYYYRQVLCQRGTHFHQPNIRTKQCVACKEQKQPSITEEYPDLILSKESAIAIGSNVFRTGELCRRGHNGYRYVSSGACIKCMRSEPVIRPNNEHYGNTTFTIEQQLKMFIGYSKDNRGMTRPDGKRLNMTQFMLKFPYPSNYLLKDGSSTKSPWDAFIKNFTC